MTHKATPAYIIPTRGVYHAHVQAPSGDWIELVAFASTESAMRSYLTDKGYQIVPPTNRPLRQPAAPASQSSP